MCHNEFATVNTLIITYRKTIGNNRKSILESLQFAKDAIDYENKKIEALKELAKENNINL